MRTDIKATHEVETLTTYSGLDAPLDWHIVERFADGYMWQRLRGEAIKVMETISLKGDGKRWLHVSVSKVSKHKMPTYDDVQLMRQLFIGDRESYMIFPTSDRYVNINPVLHLFCCLDMPGGVLPQMEGYRNDIPELRGKKTV